MTVITVNALETMLGGAAAAAKAYVTVEYKQSGGRPAVVADGADVTLARTVRVEIRDGVPVSTLEVDPTVTDVTYAKLTVRSYASGTPQLVWNVTIPASGTYDIGDLTQVDPDSFEPVSAGSTVAQQLALKANTADLGTAAAEDVEAFATSAQGDKADSAYQKPGTGVPASDLEEAVRTSLGKADEAVPNTVEGRTALAASPELGAAIDELSAPQPFGAIPTFVRLNDGAPILTVAAQNPAPDAFTPSTSTSIYYFQAFSAADMGIPDPIDNYYFFDSTDHQDAGIMLRTAPTPLGPITTRGQVFRDTVSGEQTETFAPFKNPRYGEAGEKRFLALYQQKDVSGAVGVQTTMWAESDDFVTWTRGGIAIDITPEIPGDGHTGYRAVNIEGRKVYAHGLYGGGNYATFALHASDDGKTYDFVQRLGWGRDQTGDGRRFEWSFTSIVRWRGQRIWIGYCSEVVSGVSANDARLAVAPISSDLAHIVGKPQYILYPPSAAESTEYRGAYATVFNGELYLYYIIGETIAGGQRGSKVFVAKAEG